MIDQNGEKLEQAYRDRIAALEEENAHLWTEIRAKQSTIEALLPLRQSSPKGAGSWFWYLLLVLTAAAVVALCVLAFGSRKKAEPVKHTPAIRRIPYSVSKVLVNNYLMHG